MKPIFVVLLVIGVASAVPLKHPRKNLQDLLTQQNFNTVLQQIQQNQDLYQSLIATYPAQYQLATQWLASQGFFLPRSEDSDGFDIGNLISSILEQLSPQLLEDLNEIVLEFIQPVADEIFIFAILHPADAPVPISFIESLIQNTQQTSSQLTDGPSLEYYIQLAFAAYQWIYAHPNDVPQLTNFFNNYFSVDQFLNSLINTIGNLLSNAANLFHEQVGSLNSQQIFQEFFTNLDFEEFLSSETIQEILMYCITNLDEAAVPISFLTSLGVNYFQVVGQIFAGTFNPEQLFTPEIATAAYQWIVAHPNDVQQLATFFIGYLPIDPFGISLINTVLNLFPNFFSQLSG